MDNDQNLGPLVEPVQAWWTTQHEPCQPVPVESYDPPEIVPFSMFQYRSTIRPFCGFSCGWKGDRTFDQLLLGLRPRLKASAVEAAQMLEQPDAQIALKVASSLVPQPIGDELTLVTDLIEAAGAQTVKDRNRALVGAGIAFALIVAFLLSRGE